MNPNNFFRKRRVFSFFNYVLAVTMVLNFCGIAFSQKIQTDSISRTDADVTTGGTVPRYGIYEITSTMTGITATQAFGISPQGNVNGRVITSNGSQIFAWDRTGIVLHPNLMGRDFCVANASNQLGPFSPGATVGTCSTTLFGSSRLPVIWRQGVPTQLTLPQGETLGDANDINASEIAVGSVGGGSLQKAVYYSNNTTTTYISQTTSNGSFFVTAFGINNSNRIVGQGIDPNNAARNVGMVYDIGSSSAFEVGALPNANGALAFAIGNGGHIVGSSMMNQGAGLPFIWTESGGMVAIPLPTGTTQGSARAVNTAGWAVGTASSAFAIPFLYDGTNTYRLQDLIPVNSGWDLSMNTSSSAMGISDGNVIVGTGVFNGQIRAFAMFPALENLTLSGRVFRLSDSAGISKATITISGGNLSSPVTAQTNGFGYYNFTGLQSDTLYTVTVSSKQYTFLNPTRQLILQASRSDYNFAGQ